MPISPQGSFHEYGNDLSNPLAPSLEVRGKTIAGRRMINRPDFTEPAWAALRRLNMEAQALNSGFISTAHLVLATLRTGVATQTLGCSHLIYRAAVETLALSEQNLVSVPMLPLTLRTRRVLRDAVSSSQTNSLRQAGTLHLLLMVLQDADNTAVHALTHLGKDVRQLQLAIARDLDDGLLECSVSGV
jgi:ATP-dependent Clp protease ATP-binding subunit ClpA